MRAISLLSPAVSLKHDGLETRQSNTKGVGPNGQPRADAESHGYSATWMTSAQPLSDGAFAPLTRREREVLQLYLELLNAKKVARRLGTRAQTVRNQLAAIEHKLGLSSREELVAFAVARPSA
jgi:DNA-binding CsgD family transcriptional regulator